jgi:dienelactone hydrolase
MGADGSTPTDGSTPPIDGDSGVASCTAADLAKCDYAERSLKATEREGINVQEPTTGRVLPILARIPQGAGPFPVVLWSHGGEFNENGHRLSRDWGAAIAAQGYVVLHTGHVPLQADAARAVCTVASIPTSECTPGTAPNGESPLAAMVRALDHIAVLDRLKALSDESVARGGPALDLKRVATAGWSGGSRGQMLLLGAKVRPSATAPPFGRPDARVVAAVTLSPSGPGFGTGFFDDGSATSWTSMRGPVFMGTGQNDVQPDKPEIDGPNRSFAFTAQPGDGSRRFLYSNLPIGVGGHTTYGLGDATSTDARLARFSRALRSAVLAFLDANVRGDAAAKAWLATDNAKVLAGDVDWRQR